MNLDEELAALLARLGVELEENAAEREREGISSPDHMRGPQLSYGTRGRSASEAEATPNDQDGSTTAVADLSLFQGSREHYGVFYRLDLVHGQPHLRIYTPEEEGALKMRCYLVRAAPDTPLHQWFMSAREHEGSQAFEDARDTAQQHLLFAAGELMKRLFWTGDIEYMSFPDEIVVQRLV